MQERFTEEQYAIMDEYLSDAGYASCEAWAEDSDYFAIREPEGTSWVDAHGNGVDIRVQLWFALEAAQEVAEESRIGV